MTIYDFKSDFYFIDNYALSVMVEYYKKKNQVTQKEINESMNIPKSNYRRAQQKNFVGYDKMLQKMATYLGIPVNVDLEKIRFLDDQFSHFYTCIVFSRFFESKSFFDNIVANFSHYDKTILMIPYYLAQFIYYLSEVNYTNKINFTKINESVDILQSLLEKMSEEHRFLFYEFMTNYSGIIKNRDDVIHYSRLTSFLSSNFPDLEPNANYHISFGFFMVSDFIDALIFANKALPKLEEQLNYTKAVFCRMNIAALYKKLGHFDEAKRLLKKNLIYLNFNDIPRLDQITYLNYADCMLMDERYEDALKYYLKIENEITKKQNYESIMIVYCMYKANKESDARVYISNLVRLHSLKKFPYEYLTLIHFFESYFEKESNSEILKKFRVAQEYMPSYRFRGQYIQELAQNIVDSIQNTKNNKHATKEVDNNYNVFLM